MLLQDISQIDPLPRQPVRNHRDRDQEPNPVHGWNGKPYLTGLGNNCPSSGSSGPYRAKLPTACALELVICCYRKICGVLSQRLCFAKVLPNLIVTCQEPHGCVSVHMPCDAQILRCT